MSVSGRATNILLVLILAVGISIVAMLASGVRGGPLDPPAPPASTAGVLRPGTPITSLPFTISQPGNYYLTGNLTLASAGNGIMINADDVTLDLGGFTIDGGGAGAYGVLLTNGLSGEAVRNGNAEHWTGAGFLLASESLAENLQASHDTTGIIFDDGNLTGCTVAFDSQDGVQAAFATISNCNAQSDGTGFDLNSSSLSHSVAKSNTGDGIIVIGSGTIDHNTVNFNGANGIRDNGTNSFVEDNSVSNNAQTLFASGIYVSTDDNRIAHNSVSQTFGEGIAVDGSFNTIDENSTFQNTDIGIKIQGSKNTVVKNSSTGNGSVTSTNYFFGAGNNPGSIDAAIAATNPWSNTQ
jgi:parallel beta-helix repeat protein